MKYADKVRQKKCTIVPTAGNSVLMNENGFLGLSAPSKVVKLLKNPPGADVHPTWYSACISSTMHSSKSHPINIYVKGIVYLNMPSIISLPPPPPATIWTYSKEIEKELDFLLIQLKVSEELHRGVQNSIDKLRDLGYPEHNIDFIKEQFKKPLRKREMPPRSAQIEKYMQLLKQEVVKTFTYYIKVPLEQAEKMADKIIEGEKKKRPIDNLSGIKSAIEATVRQVVTTTMATQKQYGIKPPISSLPPVPIEEAKRNLKKKEEDIDMRIKELKKKKELEKQREKERQEKEIGQGKQLPQEPPKLQPGEVKHVVVAPSPELDLMKEEIEKRIAEIMRRRRVGEGQAGEPAARYGVSPEDMFKMSYAKLHFLINTEQDTDELKRLYSLVDTLSITEFDKELLKEEISQRIQSILDAEESAKPSAPEIPDEQETCPPHEAPPGFICPKCGKFVTEYEIWKLVDFEKASITSLNIDELYELMDAVHASTLDRSDKERLVFRMRERIQILKGGPDEGFAEGAAKYASFMPYQSDELSVVETNLLNVGYTLRNDGRGHMVLPNGKGVSPTNHRGIVNHWEVIVDAGYLPSSNIFKLKHSPDAIVAGAINKGWRRWSGEASYEIRDLSKPNADFINMRLKQHFDNSGLYEAHIDVWSEGKYYNFDKKIWDKSNHDILQAIKKITPKSYQPAKAMELTLMENEYLIRDPVSIGDPDVWITSKSAAFQDDIRGAHHGQVDGTLIAYDIKARITIGYIDYSIFEGKLYLNCIEVKSSHRRQGYATALLMKLKKLNPSMVIKWGMMTEDGCALKNDIEKGIEEPRHEYTKAERIAMAKAIAATVEKTTSESEGETCISIDNLSKLSKEERIRLAKKIAGGETEVISSVVRKDDDAENLLRDVKEECSEWDFGTFEVMLAGAETQDELDGMLDCLNASKLLSESQIETMRKLIEKKIMEE